MHTRLRGPGLQCFTRVTRREQLKPSSSLSFFYSTLSCSYRVYEGMDCQQMDKQPREEDGLVANPPSRLMHGTDEELATRLQTYVPVTSARNLWAFWDGGYSAMPPWTQRNVVSWARRQGQFWTIRLLDTVPESPNHVLQYIDASDLPPAVRDGRVDGKAAAQHISDFVRLAVLYKVSSRLRWAIERAKAHIVISTASMVASTWTSAS